MTLHSEPRTIDQGGYMTKLTKGSQQVDTVFELFGIKENHMTFSLGWTLAKCDVFNQWLATTMLGLNGFSKDTYIRLQDYAPQRGFTDIEIVDPGRVHIVIEAKRGFDIPSLEQLKKYAKKLLDSKDTKSKKMLIVLAKSDREEKWLKGKVQNHVKVANRQVEVKTISWRQFQDMAKKCIPETNKNAEKKLLRQLNRYLKKPIFHSEVPNYMKSNKLDSICQGRFHF